MARAEEQLGDLQLPATALYVIDVDRLSLPWIHGRKRKKRRGQEIGRAYEPLVRALSIFTGLLGRRKTYVFPPISFLFFVLKEPPRLVVSCRVRHRGVVCEKRRTFDLAGSKLSSGCVNARSILPKRAANYARFLEATPRIPRGFPRRQMIVTNGDKQSSLRVRSIPVFHDGGAAVEGSPHLRNPAVLGIYPGRNFDSTLTVQILRLGE